MLKSNGPGLEFDILLSMSIQFDEALLKSIIYYFLSQLYSYLIVIQPTYN